MEGFFSGTRRLLCLLLMLLCVCTAAQAQIYSGLPPEEWRERDVLEWIIFDTNEADAMLLRCGGESMLVDGGSVPFGERLRDDLAGRGLEHGLKYIFSTHHHDDHIDGIYHLFQSGFTAGEYLHSYDGKTVQKTALLKRAVDSAIANGVPVRIVQDGDLLTLGKAQLQVIQCMTQGDENGRSLALKVNYKDSSVLLCADITNAAQSDLLRDKPAALLQADLIKIPHHALTRLVKEFLDTVAPQAAVITNVKAIADPRLVTQLEVRDIDGYYSGEGAVYAVTDGRDWYISQTMRSFAPLTGREAE